MRRHPLLPPTLGFLGGIGLAQSLGPSRPVVGVAAAAAVLTLAGQVVLLLRERARPDLARWFPATTLATSVALGALALGIDAMWVPPADLRRHTSPAPTVGRLRVRLTETPSLRLAVQRGRTNVTTSVRASVLAWGPGDANVGGVTGQVLWLLRGPLPTEACRGSVVEARGILKAPEAAEAPGLFDPAFLLGCQDIHRIFQAEGVDGLQITPPAGGIPWSERFLPWAHAALSQGVPDDEPARLLRAMTLGWKTPFNGDVDDVFMRAGTMHVFAISGLHIALLMAMVVQLFRALRLPRLAAGAIALPLTWAYVAATGWQASAIRSAVMASVVLAGTSLERPGDLLNSLAGAALVILVAEPQQLFQGGFQLSFGAVAGLALLATPVEELFIRGIRQDPWLPEALRPRWQRWVVGPARLLARHLAVGVAALVATLPLTVHHFHLASPVGLVANLVVVPLSSLALAATTASLAVAAFFPGASALFNASGWLWMRGMVDLSRWFASWPGGWWSVAAPPWPWWIGWYAAVGWARHALCPPPAGRSTIPRWAVRGWGLAVGVWFVTAAGFLGRHLRTPRLFVFRSEPAVVVQTGGDTTLLDGGRAGSGHRLVLPFLRAQGVNRLGTHWVSQGVQRFCGLGPELLEDLPPREVWIPSLSATRQPVLRKYLEELARAHVPTHPWQVGRTLQGWTVLAPEPPGPRASTRSVDHAPVLRGEFGGVRVLWLGGIGHHVLDGLWHRPGELRADVVVTVAVTGVDPLPPELVTAAAPRLAVVLTTTATAAGRLDPLVRERLHAAPFPVLITDETGAVSLEFRNGRIRHQVHGPETAAPAASPRRQTVPVPGHGEWAPDPAGSPQPEPDRPE